MADRNTVQKEIIHRTLCEIGGHPSAATVYDHVHRDHSTISRSTVYRVLSRMAEEGKILRLELGGSDSRYDTVHEMARDEARHGKAFKGLLERYFG